jgi:hypothetical protein
MVRDFLRIKTSQHVLKYKIEFSGVICNEDSLMILMNTYLT